MPWWRCKPDLLVVTPSRQAANQLIDPMERLGVPIMVLLQRSVPEILANIRLMGGSPACPSAARRSWRASRRAWPR